VLVGSHQKTSAADKMESDLSPKPLRQRRTIKVVPVE
jgi:hypothetical protein